MCSDNQNAAYMFVAGGVAGVVAKTAIAPIDRLKLQLQLANPLVFNAQGKVFGLLRAGKYLYQKEGILGLYRGHSLTVLRIFPYAGINFFAFEYLKRQLNTRGEDGKLAKFLAGSLAGAVSVSLTYPFDVLRARIAFLSPDPVDIKRAMSSCSLNTFRYIMQGYFLTICGIIPYAGVSFCSFDFLRSKYLGLSGNSTVPHELNFLFGTFSGLLAQVASYPIDVLRRRQQLIGIALHLGSHDDNRGFKLLRNIYLNSGIKGFYRGVMLNFIKVGPSSGLSFLTYEFLKQIIMT